MSQEWFLQYPVVEENGKRSNASRYVTIACGSHSGVHRRNARFGLRAARRAAASETGSWLGHARPVASEVSVPWSFTEKVVSPS